MSFINDTKQWFLTNKKPTQLQFFQKFEWLRWKDQPIAINEVTGLQAILNGLATPLDVYTKLSGVGTPYFITIPEGYAVETVYVEPVADSVITYAMGELPEEGDGIGIIGAGYEIIEKDAEIAADAVAIFDRKIRQKAEFKISFYNMPANTIIRVVKRLVVPPIIG